MEDLESALYFKEVGEYKVPVIILASIIAYPVRIIALFNIVPCQEPFTSYSNQRLPQLHNVTLQNYCVTQCYTMLAVDFKIKMEKKYLTKDIFLVISLIG